MAKNILKFKVKTIWVPIFRIRKLKSTWLSVMLKRRTSEATAKSLIKGFVEGLADTNDTLLSDTQMESLTGWIENCYI